jgi:hypothetical protein
MDLVREAQAADPEADALFALLEALRDVFGGLSFTAKEVQVSAQTGFMQNNLDVALRDLAGDRALSSAKALGRVLKFREDRIVHGLRLKGRQNKSSGAREYRCETVEAANPEKTDFDGFNGFVSSHTEKIGEGIFYKAGETNPPNPPNPAQPATNIGAAHQTNG